MARWRLRAPHYLNVVGCTYEYTETLRESGKQKRLALPVPMFLDPEAKPDQNYPDEIIVSDSASSAHPRDYVFLGDPTPDMEPLDDAAQAISDGFMAKWDAQGTPYTQFDNYGDKLLRDFNESVTKTILQARAPEGGTSEFAELREQVAALAKQNQALATQLAAVLSPPASPTQPRRVPNS